MLSLVDLDVPFPAFLAQKLAHASPVDVGLFTVLAAAGILATTILAYQWRRMRSARSRRLAQRSTSQATPPPERFEDAPVALLGFSSDGRLLRSNREACRLLNIPQVRTDEPRDWSTIFGPDSLDEVTLSLQQSPQAELEVAWGAGTRTRWFRLACAKASEGFELFVEDITDRRSAEAELRHVALHDPLTGLLNRRGFAQRMELAAAASRSGKPLAIGYLDLDRFKPVNDMFGHAAGDRVLQQVADRLREHVRSPHTVARVGGDEFVMLFVGIPLAEARATCVAALGALRDSPFRFSDKAFLVGGSIGLTPVNGSAIDEDVMLACDRACAEAKHDGGGRVVVVSDGAAAALERSDEERLLQVLCDEGEASGLTTNLQPIVSLHHPRKSLSYEVLARLLDAKGEPMPPARFMQACERNGLSSRLDRSVLLRTLEWIDGNAAHRERLGFAALNVGRASLNDERFVADVRSLLRAHPTAARRICFDISESAAIADSRGTRRFVDIVRSFDARLALDDFGAQYTSFSHIREFRSDFIKIDGSLIRDIDANPASFSIVRSIVDVCHDLGTACIAEWAETEAILSTLLELDIDYAQGYALSRPLEADALLDADHCAAFVADPRIAELLDREAPRRSPAIRPIRTAP